MTRHKHSPRRRRVLALMINANQHGRERIDLVSHLLIKMSKSTMQKKESVEQTATTKARSHKQQQPTAQQHQNPSVLFLVLFHNKKTALKTS